MKFLELNHLSLPLLVSSQFEMLATLKRDLFTDLAVGALHPQHNLLGGLGLLNDESVSCRKRTRFTCRVSYLLSEDGFRLSTITLLFPVVTTTTLGSTAFLRLLVLRYFVDLVGFAFLAVGTTTLRYVHLDNDGTLATD